MRHAFIDIADKTMCSRCGNEVFRVDEVCPGDGQDSDPVFTGPDKNIGPAHWGKTTQGE